MLTYTMCFLFEKCNWLWKGHCMRKRSHFWHRSRHVLHKWDALPFENKCTCWREHLFQRDAKLLSRESSKSKCMNMCWLKGLTRLCHTQFYKLIGCLCFGIVVWHILRHKSKTKLPNTCAKPLSFPQWYLHFSRVFTGFSNETKDPNKCAKKQDCTQGGKCRELGPVGQAKTKKPARNQKTKKKQKIKIAHPKGRGSDAECWVLSFFLFFCFLVCVCG